MAIEVKGSWWVGALMSKQSPIFIKTEAFLLWLIQHTEKYPKHERFRLAKRIEDAAFEFHACLLQAVNPRQDKAEQLANATVELNKLRTYLRLAVECRYTSHGQYGYIAQQLTEIGKLLGGWQKV